MIVNYTVDCAAKCLNRIPYLIVDVIFAYTVRVSLRQEYIFKHAIQWKIIVYERLLASRDPRQWNTNDTLLIWNLRNAATIHGDTIRMHLPVKLPAGVT